VAHASLDEIIARLRRLDPDKLGRVTRIIDVLEAEPLGTKGFDSLCGILPKADADSMMAAIAECERVDQGEW
jgi:hypothetical protein